MQDVHHHSIGTWVKAVFRGGEWQEAQRLLLEFVRSKAPARGSVKRQELGPRWAPQFSASPVSGKRGKSIEMRAERRGTNFVKMRQHSERKESAFSLVSRLSHFHSSSVGVDGAVGSSCVRVGDSSSKRASVRGGAHPTPRVSKHQHTYSYTWRLRVGGCA